MPAEETRMPFWMSITYGTHLVAGGAILQALLEIKDAACSSTDSGAEVAVFLQRSCADNKNKDDQIEIIILTLIVSKQAAFFLPQSLV